MPRSRLVTALVAGVLAASLLAIRGPLLRATIAGVLDVATGYRMAFDAISLERDRTVVRGLTVAYRGQRVLSVSVVELHYRLRDLLPGGAHRYGIHSVALVRPRLTLVRARDGSFAVGAPGSGGAGQAPLAGAAPLAVSARVSGGSIELLDAYRVLPPARRLALEAIAGRVAFDSAGRSSYRLQGRVAGAPAQTFTLAGRSEAQGYAVHRLRARGVRLVPLLDYLINSVGARALDGRLSSLDVRAYTFGPGSSGLATYHLAGSGEVEAGALRIPGLVPPATRIRGRIDIADGGIVAPHLVARLGPLAVALAGGLYDWHAPSFRLGVAAPLAPLARVRRLFAFSQKLPLSGDVRLATLLEGPAGDPLVATRIAAPAAGYAAFPVTRISGRAIYAHGAVELVNVRGGYAGLAVAAGGAVVIGAPATTQLVVSLGGAAERVPYLAQAAPGTDLEVSAVLAGAGTRLSAFGTAVAHGHGTLASVPFHLNEFGDGVFGPLNVVKTDGSSLAGALYAQRSTSEAGFWLEARGFRFSRPSVAPHLPGIALAPPQFGGILSGELAADGPPSAFRVVGRVRARAVRVGTLAIDAAAADLAGGLREFSLGRVAAHGPWGAFAGRGEYAGTRLALAGRYAGTFAQLAGLTGNIGAAGPVAGPVALLLEPARTLVQARGDGSPGASVHGVGLTALSGTLEVSGRDVRLFSGTAVLGGGAFAAAGTLGRAGRLGLSLADVTPMHLSDKLPLQGGRVSVSGTLTGAPGGQRLDGGLAVGGTSVDRLPLAASGDFTLRGAHLQIGRTDATLGPALGRLAGSIDNLGAPGARYDIGVDLTAARLAPFARAIAPERSDVAGTLAGRFRITGTAGALTLAGSVRAPEGSLAGVAFQAASAGVRLDAGGMTARGGQFDVGSTHATFDAAFRGNDATLRVAAPQADLSDFDGYFDAGDMLAGRGRIAAGFVKRGTAIATSGDTEIAALRYRRFDLGAARLRWRSRGPNVAATASFGGPSGRLLAAGTLGLARNAPLAQLFGRSRLSGEAHLRDLDLGIWLPALGYQLPLGGRVDADAVVSGPVQNPDVRTQATLAHGSYGRFPVDRLTLAATSTRRRTTITQAEVALPSLTATLSGSLGLRGRDPLALALHAKSDDVGALAARAYGMTALHGSGEVDVKIAGTRAVPRIAGGFDLEQGKVRGVTIPRALGEFNLRGRELVLSDVEVAFATGTLYFAGSVPLELAPLGLGPPQAPITLELTAKGLDLADAAPLLPDGSTLRGRVDGHVQISGTAGAPRLGGRLGLTDGAFRSPLETDELRRLRASLALGGNTVRLEALHAEAGGGALDASGSATFPNLVHPGTDAAYGFLAQAQRLHLNLPAYGYGQVDGALSLTHAPGTLPAVAGKLALSDATIPFSALLGSGGSAGLESSAGTGARPAQPDLAFDVNLAALRNVRVRSPNVDIGVRGDVHAGGTRSAPQLAGDFTSTGGTLAYFNTVFRLTDGSVAFAPERGLVPTLAARATTHVIDPDPNSVRNVSGSADITLSVSGPLTGLSIGLSSEPAYDRQQILGLLLDAPAFGATNLFGERTGPTLYGSNAPATLPSGVGGGRTGNGQLSVAQEAFGIANAQFTRTLLAPIESTFASAVGLSSFNVNVDFTGSVGLTARKILGKKLNALYGTSFGYPYRQSFGFELKPNDATAAQVTVFQTLGASGLDSLAPATLALPNQRLQAAQPATGTVGFSLSLQRLYP